MRYRLLGPSGLRVSELCLGTMTFGEDWGWGSTQDESKGIFDAFRAAGGNFIDTANVYTNGTSEKLLADMIATARDEVVLATKYTNAFPNPDGSARDPNLAGNHRKNMVQAVEASLKRLKTDYIDVYYVHIWDQLTPIEEVVRAFDDLVRAGKVLYPGISDAPAWWVSRANTMAELRGWSPFVCLQIEYSLVERTVERELLPMAQALNLTTVAWSPLAGGVLSGKYTNPDGSPKSTNGEGRMEHAMMSELAQLSPQQHQAARAVLAVAAECGRSPAQVALAWLRHQHNVIPIIGARRLKQVEDNLGCLDLRLNAAQLDALNAASQIEMGFPYSFYAKPMVHKIVHAGARELIDA